MSQGPVAVDIVKQLAERDGCEPEDLSPPLDDVIDTDALETLSTLTGSRQADADVRVEFQYEGYVVTVDESGNAIVNEASEDAVSPETPSVTDGSRAGLSAELERRERVLDDVSEIIGDHDRSFDERLDALLETVRAAIGVEFATLSYVDTETYVFEAVDVPDDAPLAGGTTVPIDELPNCKTVVETERELVLSDVEEQAPELADSTWGIESYLGVPVFVDGEVYGTFCFYDMEAQTESFSAWDLTIVELLSSWVSSELEQRERERSVSARTLDHPLSS